MVITAKELLNLQQNLWIKIRGEEVDVNKHIVALDGDTEESDRSDPLEVIMIDLCDSGDVYYCLPEEPISLNEEGEGVIELYMDRFEFIPVDERKGRFAIEVKALLPFTAAIRTKMLLGIL